MPTTSEIPVIREPSIANFRDAYCFIDISKTGQETAGRTRFSGVLNHILLNFFEPSFVFRFTRDQPAAFSGAKGIKISKGD